MYGDIIKSYGFKILNSKYQSWGGFTSQLFNGPDDEMNEFDRITFYFNGGQKSIPRFDEYEFKVTPEYKIYCGIEKEDESVTAGYFGRDLKDVHIFLKKVAAFDGGDWHGRVMEEIKAVLPIFYEFQNVPSSPEPRLVIENYSHNQITGYYVWKRPSN